MSKLLFDEQPLIVSRELAKLIGLNEAIVLQQIHYWIEINRKANKNFYDGRYWTYNSMKNWHENDFSFWSYDTVKRTFSSLEKKGYFISGNFNRQKFDQTKWYSIDYNALKTLNLRIGAKCTNGLEQNTPMERGILPQPIPENKKENNITENILSSPILSVLTGGNETSKDKTERSGEEQITTQAAKTKITQKKEGLHANANKQVKPSASNYDFSTVLELVKTNINFDYILADKTVDADMLNEICHIVASTISADYKDGYVSMGEERMPAAAVKSVFMKLDRDFAISKPRHNKPSYN